MVEREALGGREGALLALPDAEGAAAQWAWWTLCRCGCLRRHLLPWRCAGMSRCQWAWGCLPEHRRSKRGKRRVRLWPLAQCASAGGGGVRAEEVKSAAPGEGTGCERREALCEALCEALVLSEGKV